MRSNSPFLREEVEVGEGWLDDDCEVVSLVPPALYQRADLLHIAVQEPRHLVPGQWSPSKTTIQTGTDPAVSDVTERMFVVHVLNIQNGSLLTSEIYDIL